MTETVLESYRSIVSVWKDAHEEATRVEPLDLSSGALFPSAMSRAASLDVALEAPDQQRFQMYELTGLLEYFVWLEQVLAPSVARFLPALLPDHLAVGFISIAEQEEVHSTWAYSVERAALTALGVVEPQIVPEPVLRLAAVVEAVGPEKRPLTEAFALTCAEILDFGTADRIMHAEDVHPAVRDFAAKHEREERLHRVFFRAVLDALWPSLDPSDREHLAALTRDVTAAMLAPNVGHLEAGAGAVAATTSFAGYDEDPSFTADVDAGVDLLTSLMHL